jgi:hypothetical protein
MESRFRVLFLIVAMIGLSGCAATKNLFGFGSEEAPPPTAEAPGQVIDPEVERREIKEPAIDREDFEIGPYVGIMSVEDFGADVVYGVRLAYHITEGFFVEEREYTYYNLNLGYNILPGEVFIGEGRAFNTNLYLTGGLGSTSFAGDDRFTVNFGFGYRFLLSDSIALHLDFRDHLFDIDLFGDEKTAHNLEAHFGFTVFF